MSVGSWFKDMFFEKDTEEVKEANIELKQEEAKEIKNYDYNVKIFDLIRKDDVSKVTSYIIQDKSLALVKMHKFIGNKDDLKDVLNELKQTCDNCNSKILGITNNMYFVTKNSINIERENNSLI